MDPMFATIVFRAFERVLVVAVGALSIWLGYKLFISMPKRDASTGKLSLPGGISIYLTRVGPGVFFALFGAAVIALSFRFGVSFTEGIPSAAVSATPGADSGQVAAAPIPQRGYVGAGPGLPEQTERARAADRYEVLNTIRDLNSAAAHLRSDIEPAERADAENAIAEAKLMLLRSVWDEQTWGAYDEFRRWVLRGAKEQPPQQISRAVDVFRAGGPQPAP